MFEDLVECGAKKRTRTPWTIAVSFVLQCLVLGILILIPLIYTEAIDLKQFSSTMLVAVRYRGALPPEKA